MKIVYVAESIPDDDEATQILMESIYEAMAVRRIVIFLDDVIAVMLGVFVCGVLLLEDAHIPLRVRTSRMVAAMREAYRNLLIAIFPWR